MASKIEEQLDLIKACFDPEAFDLLEVSGSFRVTLGSGQHIYIYPETYENTITVRYETKEADPDKRTSEIDMIRQTLAPILPFADISDFSNIQTVGSKQVYTAKLEMADLPPAAKAASSAAAEGQAEEESLNLATSDRLEVISDQSELRSPGRL